MTFRMDPALLAAVKTRTSNVTKAVEEGLLLWLARDKRKAAKAGPDALGRHLAPPTAREIAALRKDDAA